VPVNPCLLKDVLPVRRRRLETSRNRVAHTWGGFVAMVTVL